MPQNAAALDGTHVDAGGVKTFYLEKGEGPVMVLMHGSSIAIDARVTWFKTIDALADRFRVIAFDQVGFGHTEMPGRGRYLGRLERARHAVDFLDALNLDDVVLVGHSEGGFIATQIAITQPHRIAKLVVVTSGGTAPKLGGERDRPWLAASADAYGFTEAMEEEACFLKTMDKFLYTPDEEFLSIVRSNYIHARTSGNLGLFRDRGEADANPAPYTELQEKHIHPHLPSLDVPALLVWANDDATVPVMRGLRLIDRKSTR
ncbi:MAG: alpha/beta hydrolase, partial [Alphaproteobacteria bacterium]